VLRAHGEWIVREVLAVNAVSGVPAGAAHTKSVRLDSQTVTLGITREQDRAAATRITRPGPPS
jgi:hypothetical protein